MRLGGATSSIRATNVAGSYFELALHIGFWNSEMPSYSLSLRRGERMAYISGVRD